MAKKKKPDAAPEPAPKGTLATAKDAAVKAAGKVVAAVTRVAEAAQEHVVRPVVEAVTKKPKKARFVRETKAKKPAPPAAPLPPRSTKAAGKLMSKNLTVPPKEDLPAGQKPRP